jgi:hypothetical protein
MALPATAILDSIRALRGKARITFPEGNKRMERIATFPKGDWQLALLTADPDDSDCKLTDQQKLKEDNQLVEVYRVYDKLPGVTLSGEEVTSQFGGGVLETNRQEVVAGTSVAGGLKVISASVTPVNAAKSVLQQASLPDGESWPVLYETEFVPELRVFVKTAKTFVENTGERSGTITGGTSSDLIVTEYKDFDKWKTIQIVGKVNFSDIGSSRTFRKPMQYSIPDEIPVTPTIIRAYALTGIPEVEGTLLDEILRDAAVTDSMLDYQVVAGYRGSFSATVTRTLSMNPATEEEYKWFPTAMQRNVAINGPSYNTGGGTVAPQGARGKILSFQTPVAIHPAWDILVANTYTLTGVDHYQWDDAEHTTPTTGWPIFTPVGTPPTPHTTVYWGMQPIFEQDEIRFTSPATIPSAIPHGVEIIAAVNSSEWRFGLWVNDVYRIVVP